MYKIDKKQSVIFPSAERASYEELHKQKEYIIGNSPFVEIINAIPDALLILNNCRQIIFVNTQLLKLLDLDNDSSLIGRRPGEAFDCEHAFETEGGCGTTEFCITCGVEKSIYSSLNYNTDIREYNITQNKTKKTLDLRIWATHLPVQGESFTIFVLQDVQDEKKRKVLEKMFFHDILNTAGALRSLNELIEDADSDELAKYKDIFTSLTERLIDEIKAQQQLNYAENNELAVKVCQFNSLGLLKDAASSFIRFEISKDKNLLIEQDSESVIIENDRTLLWRVLKHMIKNALEASKKGQIVKAGCRVKSSMVEFWINNPAFMEKEIQLQVFQKSFSTKRLGRGLGTYSIKLLTERYLQGNAWFTSNESEGTTFFVSIPLKYKSPD